MWVTYGRERRKPPAAHDRKEQYSLIDREDRLNVSARLTQGEDQIAFSQACDSLNSRERAAEFREARCYGNNRARFVEVADAAGEVLGQEAQQILARDRRLKAINIYRVRASNPCRQFTATLLYFLYGGGKTGSGAENGYVCACQL